MDMDEDAVYRVCHRNGKSLSATFAGHGRSLAQQDVRVMVVTDYLPHAQIGAQLVVQGQIPAA
jgi:hypothetical protein